MVSFNTLQEALVGFMDNEKEFAEDCWGFTTGTR